MHFKKNDKIGSYTVAFPHKQGSYAETYRVKDTSGKTRFLKLINYSKLNRNQIDDNGRVIEVEIAKLLNHHNLCQFIDSGNMMMNGSQYAWFVTEFVSGETLLHIPADTRSAFPVISVQSPVSIQCCWQS